MADNYSILVVKENDMVKITHNYLCRHCRNTFDITFDTDDLDRWFKTCDRDHVDYLTDNEIELIQFNRCQPCHDKKFGFT